ncbi:nuclear transport factor 2 family protein [Chitinimonas koreensis]|uniref:nuclear transport factor 2 family protein n=1 Tax=Chitinimonas koreensis TaxID=356302 RepID=UPI0004232A6A|nr:nuclear transport factor 2 family protein [Chitinimonas koreensis]QNM95316.1 nuclear transport factor 2 family protein [Chitinimonas koreensis]
MKPDLPSAQDALIDWYASLSPDSLQALPNYYHPDARFTDPFNDVRGHAAIMRVFRHMFETTRAPRFVVLERVSQDGRLFVSWDFLFGLGRREYRVHGSSLLHFDLAGQVVSHRDYWDPAGELWQRMPLLGGPVAWLRRRFRAG